MSVKIKDIKTMMIKENDGSYSITCSALGVYSSGKDRQDAKKNFLSALDVHLSVLREKAIKVTTLQEKSSSKKFRF